MRNAKARETQYKLHDDGGLFVIVRPSGGKLWRFKYRFAGKEQQLSFGTYPDVGLKAARARHDEARSLLAEGIDPGADRKRKAIAAEIAAANTFGTIANEFVEKRERDGMAVATMIKLRWFASLLEKDNCHLFKWPATREDFWRAKIGKNRDNDSNVRKALLEQGWRVATVWECALKGRAKLFANVAEEMLIEWLKSGDVTIEISGST